MTTKKFLSPEKVKFTRKAVGRNFYPDIKNDPERNISTPIYINTICEKIAKKEMHIADIPIINVVKDNGQFYRYLLIVGL